MVVAQIFGVSERASFCASRSAASSNSAMGCHARRRSRGLPRRKSKVGLRWFRAFAERMPSVPLLANMNEFGETPFFTAMEFEAMGCAMVIWLVSAPRAANKAQAELYAAIARDGGTHKVVDRMQTRAELYATG
jgi:hypothetical protein